MREKDKKSEFWFDFDSFWFDSYSPFHAGKVILQAELLCKRVKMLNVKKLESV